MCLFLALVFFFFFWLCRKSREGANREKPTVKKIINNEMFFFTVYVRYKPWKIGVNGEKSRHQTVKKSAPKIHHFFTVYVFLRKGVGKARGIGLPKSDRKKLWVAYPLPLCLTPLRHSEFFSRADRPHVLHFRFFRLDFAVIPVFAACPGLIRMFRIFYGLNMRKIGMTGGMGLGASHRTTGGLYVGFSWFVRGFSWFVLVLFLGLFTAPTRNSPKRVCHTIRTFPESLEVGNPPPPQFGNPPSFGMKRHVRPLPGIVPSLERSLEL